MSKPKVKLTAKASKKIDSKKLDAIVARVKSLQRVAVGVPADNADRTSDGEAITNAQVAAIHEYGAPSANIPERPFLRNTIRAHLNEYMRLNRINIVRVLHNEMTMEQALGQLGVMATGHVQKFIYSNTYELKPETIARKGSSRALVGTGQLAQSISYVLDTGELK